jgi:hypothetical protein
MAKVLIAVFCMLLVWESRAATAAPATREQVEQLLASQIPSGSSPAMVAKFLNGHGIEHGAAEKSGPSVLMLGSFRNLAGSRPAERVNLQVRFSFLQDRLIGYSFAESPATR